MKQKFAIFDIDHTILSEDSMFRFVRYGIRRYPRTSLNVVRIGLFTVLYMLKIISVEKVKEAYFHAIRYMDESDLEHFYDTELSPRLYEAATQELQRVKQEGYHVLLITASPHAYMKYFAKMPEVDAVIGTDLRQTEDRYSSIVEGVNNKGEEKAKRLQRYLEEHNLEIDAEQSCAYSDSLSDWPLFRLVKHRYLINRSGEGLIACNWKPEPSRSRYAGKLFMILSAILAATGQLFWAWSSESVLYMVFGFGCYGLGMLFMLRALAQEKLSVAYPLMCVSYIVAMLYGWWFLGEEITVTKAAAVVMIGIGVALTSYDQ
ncbi:HAD-IB family hydrolase [Paenibacillus kobensis]|uniref:HAD-IB family hydrolase n=1 Tax=Paenibacillus kobensis TaxID=59841 RepID=UPI0027D84A93|nr:HAD-IB family hydrolase [Paenibacillus kobensis]